MWGSAGLGCPCVCVSLSEGIRSSSPPPTPPRVPVSCSCLVRGRGGTQLWGLPVDMLVTAGSSRLLRGSFLALSVQSRAGHLERGCCKLCGCPRNY